jgi:hypothetical protein
VSDSTTTNEGGEDDVDEPAPETVGTYHRLYKLMRLAIMPSVMAEAENTEPPLRGSPFRLMARLSAVWAGEGITLATQNFKRIAKREFEAVKWINSGTRRDQVIATVQALTTATTNCMDVGYQRTEEDRIEQMLMVIHADFTAQGAGVKPEYESFAMLQTELLTTAAVSLATVTRTTKLTAHRTSRSTTMSMTTHTSKD